MASLPHDRTPDSAIFGLLDIGTAKVTCVVLQRTAIAPTRVIGIGHQYSQGLKSSVVVNTDAAAEVVRATIAQAEQMAGIRLEQVVLAAACGRLASTHLTVGLDLAGRAVSHADINKLLDAARAHGHGEDRAPLHVEAVGARLDSHAIANYGLDQLGRRLSLDVHAVTADRTALNHLIQIVERCQVQVTHIAAAPLASALAVTTPDERTGGTAVIDCGAGTTGVAVFVRGTCLEARVLQIGGNHLTFDLMRAFGCPFNEAERIKKNYAKDVTALAVRDRSSAADQAGGDTPAGDHSAISDAISHKVTRAAISKILTSRLDALLQQIGQQLERLRVPRQGFGAIVLTGGGSQLPLLAERATAVLDRPVRAVSALQSAIWPRALVHPAFTVAAGLLQIAESPGLGLRLAPAGRHPNGADYWAGPADTWQHQNL